MSPIFHACPVSRHMLDTPGLQREWNFKNEWLLNTIAEAAEQKYDGWRGGEGGGGECWRERL